MKDRIFAFLLHASADGTNELFPKGRRLAMLAFVRQEGEEPNLELCETALKTAGWTQVEIKGTALATPESIKKMQKTEDPAILTTYADATRNGFSLLVFSIPVPLPQ